MVAPTLHLYRGYEFSYEANQLAQPPGGVCQCQCQDVCTGLDQLVYGQREYTCKQGGQVAQCTKLKSQFEALTRPNHTAACAVCTDIASVVTKSLGGSYADIDPKSFQAGADAYKQAKAKGEASIQQAIATLEQKRAHFEAQAAKIRALKDKVRVATEVLHEATGKLSGMGTSFNTLEQQNGLQYKDRVPVGIPYLPPFFTLSNRNFVVMMVCINVLLLVGIIVYAFVGRIRTDADIVATRGAAAGEGDSSGNDAGASAAPAAAPAPASAASTPPSSATEAPEATDATESSSASSTFDEPEAAPSESASAAASGSSEDTASSSASSDDASTGRARGGRRRSSLSAGRRYADG